MNNNTRLRTVLTGIAGVATTFVVGANERVDRTSPGRDTWSPVRSGAAQRCC